MNRSITLGCATGLYCPTAPVVRLAMAAFLNREGTALTPQVLVQEAAPGALDLDAAPVACQTADAIIGAFPRSRTGRRGVFRHRERHRDDRRCSGREF